MIELGQWLREAREAKGLSLSQAEEATRIRQKYLAALESGVQEDLPGDVPTRGFLRNYATYLGLNADEAMRRLGQPQSQVAQIAKDAEQTMGPRAVDYRPIEFTLYNQSPLTARWLTIGLAIGIVLVAVVLGAWLWRSNPQLIAGLFVPPATATATSTATAVTSSVTTTPTASIYRITATATESIFLLPTPTPTATPISTAEPSSTPTPPVSEMEVIARVVQRAWVRVTSDGAVILEKVLEEGSEERWIAQNSLVLRTGNAGGLEITVNGEVQSTLGALGTIEECSWTLTAGQVTRGCSSDANKTPTASVTPQATATSATGVTATQTSAATPTNTPSRSPAPTATGNDF